MTVSWDNPEASIPKTTSTTTGRGTLTRRGRRQTLERVSSVTQEKRDFEQKDYMKNST